MVPIVDRECSDVATCSTVYCCGDLYYYLWNNNAVQQKKNIDRPLLRFTCAHCCLVAT